MRTYSSSDYAGAAKRLPHGLATALHRDLGISGADYLAHAAAESRAVIVTDALKASGVDILGSHMDGTKLVVNTSTADAAAVAAAGAAVAIGAPAAVPLAKTFTPANGSAIYGGQQYFWYTVSGAVANTAQCSIGFPGYRTSDGAQQSVTAGHCLVGTSSATNIYAIPDSLPGLMTQNEFDLRTAIGHPASGSAKYGSGYDTGLLNISSSIPETGSAQTWGYSTTGMPQDQAPIEVTGYTAAIVNADLCKSGSRTGWTCGTVTAVNQSVEIGDTGGTKVVNSIVATTCLLPGDSGGAGLIGTNAVGLDDSTSNVDNCDEPGYESTFFPLVSASNYASVATGYGSTWRPKVALSQPVITTPDTGVILAATSAITGTVANPSYGETVSLFLDGSSKVFESASASSGTWSLPVSGISPGAHSYTVESFLGPWSHSSSSLANSFTALGTIVVAKPTISGTVKVGSTLTARATISPTDTTPLYLWKSGSRIVGGDQPTYAVQPTDAGARITVSVSASRAGYTESQNVISSATAAVARGTLARHVPVVTGHRNVGQTLTAKTTWGPGTVSLTYKWLRRGKAIPGATQSTYVLVAVDRGRRINVKVTGTLVGYTTASTTSSTRTDTGARLFAAAPTPTISDTNPVVGQTLRVTPGTWAPGMVKLSYQWRANGSAISKATKSTFTVPTKDVAKTITVTVTGRETGFVTATRTSVATARAASIPFKAAGTPTIAAGAVLATGKIWRVVTGYWSPAPTFGYQWLRNGIPIPGATKSIHTITSSDLGKSITVAVTARRTGYTSVKTVVSGP
jgi:hypothetical protein